MLFQLNNRQPGIRQMFCLLSLVSIKVPVHTMPLVVHKSFQIHLFVNYFYGLGITVQKNRFIQFVKETETIANCG